MTQPTTIDEVLHELDRILEETIREDTYLGIFAYVYRRTTAEIQKAIAQREFEDNTRMEALDVRFANLYLDAYRQFQAEGRVPAAWGVAFSAGKKPLSFLQHLLLGMNAHINLDLGIAAALTAHESGTEALKNDSLKINEILYRILEEMQERLGKASPLLFLLDWAGGRKDEQFIDFSMIHARDFAWSLAEKLARTPQSEWPEVIDETDQMVADFAHILVKPPGKVIPYLLFLIALCEDGNARRRIQKISGR